MRSTEKWNPYGLTTSEMSTIEMLRHLRMRNRDVEKFLHARDRYSLGVAQMPMGHDGAHWAILCQQVLRTDGMIRNPISARVSQV